MGFFSRLRNLWLGFLSLFVSGIEQNNPEAVYESAINGRKVAYAQLKKAVASVGVQRDNADRELDALEAEQAKIGPAIESALELGEDEMAERLVVRQDELVAEVAAKQEELKSVETEVTRLMGELRDFEESIRKLEKERATNIAAKKSADARIAAQEMVSGLSLDADIKALGNVREGIQKRVSEAKIGAELAADSIEKKMDKITANAAKLTAKSKVEEMKRQIAARKAGADATAAAGGGVAKTM